MADRRVVYCFDLLCVHHLPSLCFRFSFSLSPFPLSLLKFFASQFLSVFHRSGQLRSALTAFEKACCWEYMFVVASQLGLAAEELSRKVAG